MKTLFRSFVLATSMYSKLPTPRTEWSDRSMAYVFCFFPWIGLVVGGLELLWFFISDYLHLGQLLFAAVALLLPIFVTGGIHLDGFCDTCDAIGSHQSRERKLEILKDSHTGAFALIGLGCWLVLGVGLWSDVTPTAALALIPVLSRTLSGLCAVTMKNARGTGLLASFSQASDLRLNRGVLLLWLVAVGGGLLALHGWPILLGGAISVVYYICFSRREFGGITGDLAGWFVQICELVCLAAMVLAQKGGILCT